MADSTSNSQDGNRHNELLADLRERSMLEPNSNRNRSRLNEPIDGSIAEPNSNDRAKFHLDKLDKELMEKVFDTAIEVSASLNGFQRYVFQCMSLGVLTFSCVVHWTIYNGLFSNACISNVTDVFLSSELNLLRLNAVLWVDKLRELRARTVVSGPTPAFSAAAHEK